MPQQQQQAPAWELDETHWDDDARWFDGPKPSADMSPYNPHPYDYGIFLVP